LLNRAESNLLLNRVDAALADLQLLADLRFTDGGTVSVQNIRQYYGPIYEDDRIMVLVYLLDERRKEFIHEGLRWFDLKRYGIPVNHVLEDGQTVITLEAEDRRKVLQIPESAVEVGGLEPNRR